MALAETGAGEVGPYHLPACARMITSPLLRRPAMFLVSQMQGYSQSNSQVIFSLVQPKFIWVVFFFPFPFLVFELGFIGENE